MAVNRVADLSQAREAIIVIRDRKTGEVIEGVASREFYRYLSEIKRLIIDPDSPLSSLEDDTVALEAQVAANTDEIVVNQGDIDTNNTSIAQINADLVIITNDISILAGDLAAVTAALATHVTASNAHGATGDIVGNLDAATALVKGVVNEAADPGDPTGTFVTLAAVEAWAVQLRANLQAAGIMA